MTSAPRILAVGGSTRAGSTVEWALRIAAQGVAEVGGEMHWVVGRDLLLPMYDQDDATRTPAASRLVEEVRAADGLLIASPSYHGGISGLVKNALDYLEDLSGDARPYFDGRAVGLVAVAHGWQGAMSTLGQLRDVTHALRGWPTSQGVVVNALLGRLDGAEQEHAVGQLHTMGRQVAEFASRWR